MLTSGSVRSIVKQCSRCVLISDSLRQFLCAQTLFNLFGVKERGFAHSSTVDRLSLWCTAKFKNYTAHNVFASALLSDWRCQCREWDLLARLVILSDTVKHIPRSPVSAAQSKVRLWRHLHLQPSVNVEGSDGFCSSVVIRHRTMLNIAFGKTNTDFDFLYGSTAEKPWF